MAQRADSCVTDRLPPLPLDEAHWQAIFEHLGFSRMQSGVTRLLLRSACRKQIADALGISQPTVRTYLARIYVRTGTSDPMQLAMHLLAVSHQVKPSRQRRLKR